MTYLQNSPSTPSDLQEVVQFSSLVRQGNRQFSQCTPVKSSNISIHVGYMYMLIKIILIIDTSVHGIVYVIHIPLHIYTKYILMCNNEFNTM